jgi:hypothetical protein
MAIEAPGVVVDPPLLDREPIAAGATAGKVGEGTTLPT